MFQKLLHKCHHIFLVEKKTIYFSMKYGKRKTRRAICSKNYCTSAIIFPEELLAMEVLLCTENIWRSSSFATRYIECITTIHHLLILPIYDIKSIKYINNRYKYINDWYIEFIPTMHQQHIFHKLWHKIYQIQYLYYYNYMVSHVMVIVMYTYKCINYKHKFTKHQIQIHQMHHTII